MVTNNGNPVTTDDAFDHCSNAACN